MGGDVNMKDDSGKTPLMRAEEQRLVPEKKASRVFGDLSCTVPTPAQLVIRETLSIETAYRYARHSNDDGRSRYFFTG